MIKPPIKEYNKDDEERLVISAFVIIIFMIKVITDSGYCHGVKHAIEITEEASKIGGDLYLAHPLLHNLKENGKIMDRCGIRPISDLKPPYENKTIIFSAHGHSPDEEVYEGASYIDGICPFISARYQKIKEIEASGYPLVYVGKKNHQETIGFLGTFKNAFFIDQNEIENFSLPCEKGTRIVLATQTTLSEAKAEYVKNNLESDYEIVAYFPICPIYKKRFQQAYEEIEKRYDRSSLSVIVAGDLLSSNANEMYNFLKSSFEDLDIRISLSLSESEIEFLKKRDVYIVSSTSASDEQIQGIVDALKD